MFLVSTFLQCNTMVLQKANWTRYSSHGLIRTHNSSHTFFSLNCIHSHTFFSLNFIHFCASQRVSIILVLNAEDAELTPLLRLGAGACAGIIAMSATYPMDMVRGRITVQVGVVCGT